MRYIVLRRILMQDAGRRGYAECNFQNAGRKKLLIDELAAAQDRDRSYIINQALDIYLEVMEWQLAHTKEGLRQTGNCFAGGCSQESEP